MLLDVGQLDDSLECDTYVPLALREQSECVSVTVTAGTVCQAVFLGDYFGAAPRHEVGFDVGARWMSADGTGPAVPS